MEDKNKSRVAVAVLTLSVAGFMGIVASEGYTDKAIIPTKGDRWTVGYGSTYHEDGSPVKKGDTTTKERALIKAKAHISKEEAIFRKSLPNVLLHQEEYDLYMDWTYQYGTGAWNRSSMRKNLIAGKYPEACKSLLAYRFTDGFDCSTPGNKICAGVWTRQKKRYQKCIEAQ